MHTYTSLLNRNNHLLLWLIVGALISLVPIPASAQKTKVACVGNSVTAGYGLANPSTESYPGQMQVLLGTDKWEVINFGSSGRTMLKAGGYSYWDDPLYQNALASNPDIVLIGLGTNDSKRWLWDTQGSKFESDYTEMVRSFEALPSQPDIWVYLLIPGEKQDWDIYNSYIKDKVNPVIKNLALKNGWGLIDMYSVLSERKTEWYLEDNVHPSVTGAGLIAKVASETLQMRKPEITFVNNKVVGPDGYQYQWYIDGIPVAASIGGTQREMVVSKSGAYKVSVKRSENSETRIISEQLFVTVTITSNEITLQNAIRVSPNPVFDTLYIYTQEHQKKNPYRITDLSGKIFLSGVLAEKEEKIDIQDLTPGTYLLSIGDQQIKICKP